MSFEEVTLTLSGQRCLDGDDEISITASEFFDGTDPIRVNVVLVGHENVALRQLAEKTGGVVIILEDP